jgi:HD superfamily phosphohydrolase
LNNLFKYRFFQVLLVIILTIIVTSKPVVKLYKTYIDNVIELCENLEEESSEESELEDDVDEKHFLKQLVTTTSNSFMFYHAFSCKKIRLLTSFHDTPLQPPQV